MTHIQQITREMRERLVSFITSDNILPEKLIIDKKRAVTFDFEPVDDESLGLPLLRNRSGQGLQLHETLDGKPYSYVNDPDELTGGWVLLKGDTPHDIALQICADFDLS